MNMPYNRRIPRPYSGNQGAALIAGLAFLVMLTLIAITAARMAGLEERMSGNMRDRAIAVQAAEQTLRYAERDVLARISGLTGFLSTCPAGRCYNGTTGASNGTDWNTTPVWTIVSMTGAPSLAYGLAPAPAPAAAALAGVSAQPRYVLEGIRKTPPGGGEEFFYRITVRAQGANPNTVVWLQEVFKP